MTSYQCKAGQLLEINSLKEEVRRLVLVEYDSQFEACKSCKYPVFVDEFGYCTFRRIRK